MALWKTIETLRQRYLRSSSRLAPDEVLAAEEDAAPDDLGRRPEDLHDGVRDRALAAAGLAREPEDLPGGDREVDAVDRDHVAVGDAEVAHLDERLARLGLCPQGQCRLDHGHFVACFGFFFAFAVRSRGLLSSSIPARRKTRPTTVITSARPGKRNGHHSPCSTVELVWAQ